MSVKTILFAATVLVTPGLIAADQQQQPSSSRTGWPCGARLDTSYFQVAEGTGGHLVMLAPDEISGSADLLIAFGSHPHTIFRLAGSLKPGVHELKIPIDSSVESAVFSISVQCLQVAQVLRPSGIQASGEGVTDFWNFRAQRMVIVAKPEPGTWSLRVSGNGVSGIVVQGRSEIGLSVQFARPGSTTFTAIPAMGGENVVRIQIGGNVTEIHASLVAADLRKIQDLRLEAGEAAGSYLSRFTPGAEDFRVLVTGKDANGVPFQRMQASLLTPSR
jgi:hypothetical protein